MTDKPILFSAPMVRAILDGRKTQTRRILKIQPPASWEPAVGPYHPIIIDRHGDEQPGPESFGASDENWGCRLPHAPGTRLWIRETWADVNTENGPAIMFRAGGFRFCSDDAYPVEYDRYPGMKFSMWCGDLARGEPGHAWRPSIFMPRWASRIALEVTGVRVEQLQDITEADAIAEGCVFTDFGEYQPQGTASVDGGKTFHPFKMRQHNGWHCGDATTPDQCVGSAQSAYANLWDRINGPGSWDENPWVRAEEFRRMTDAE